MTWTCVLLPIKSHSVSEPLSPPIVKMCSVDKNGNVFVLTLTSDDEHRLSPALIATIRSALSQIRSQSTISSALVTTATGKFFSNGLDLAWAESSGSNSGFIDRLSHLIESLKPLIADLLSFPMPTVAAVTGHAAAAGFILAISHDYVLMRRDRGVLYMSELDIGLTMPEYFKTFFREKVQAARREVLLRARKLRAEEAAKMGIVDEVCEGVEETVEAAVQLAEKLAARKWNGEVYAEIRKGLYPDLCKELRLTRRSIVVPRLLNSSKL